MKQQTADDWFCPKCDSYVSSESVTYEETHQICGTGVIIKETKHMAQQKEQQKKLLSEVMEADQKNGLYEDSNKIVTAVEWLMQKIEKSLPNFMEVWREEFIQAKQMDKARIIDAFNRGEIQGLKSTNNSFHSSLITAEDYYNKTYGK